MKRLLTLIGLLPFTAFAQKDTADCKMDIYGCYVYALNAFAKGSDGLAPLKKQVTGKAKEVYVAKQYFTVNLPKKADKLTYQYEDINDNVQDIYTKQEAGSAGIMYMTELSVNADTCHLWMMPIVLKKEGADIEMDYPSKGCKLNFIVNKNSGKLCFANVHCPPADKQD